jgi:hypothetical protein
MTTNLYHTQITSAMEHLVAFPFGRPSEYHTYAGDLVRDNKDTRPSSSVSYRFSEGTSHPCPSFFSANRPFDIGPFY